MPTTAGTDTLIMLDNTVYRVDWSLVDGEVEVEALRDAHGADVVFDAILWVAVSAWIGEEIVPDLDDADLEADHDDLYDEVYMSAWEEEERDRAEAFQDRLDLYRREF